MERENWKNETSKNSYLWISSTFFENSVSDTALHIFFRIHLSNSALNLCIIFMMESSCHTADSDKFIYRFFSSKWKLWISVRSKRPESQQSAKTHDRQHRRDLLRALQSFKQCEIQATSSHYCDYLHVPFYLYRLCALAYYRRLTVEHFQFHSHFILQICSFFIV